MTLPGPPYLPTDEQVGVAWLKLNTLVEDSSIATSLPAAPWTDRLFLTLSNRDGGLADIDTPARTPVLELDAWAHPAAASGSTQGRTVSPPWNLANQGIELVRAAADNDTQTFMQRIELGAKFRPAMVKSLWMATHPRRIENDPNGYARFNCLIRLDWVVIYEDD